MNEMMKRLYEAARVMKGAEFPSEVARLLDESPQTLKNWEGRGISKGGLLKAQEWIGCRAEWLEKGKGDMLPLPGLVAKPAYTLIPVEAWDDNTPLDDDTVEVPIYKSAEFSSGPGRSQGLVIDEGMRLRYGKRTLRNNGVEAAMVAGGLNKGRSNEPVFPDGCIVLMDLSKTEIVEGEPYGLEHLGEFRVKQLYGLPGGGLRLRSYNRDEYPDEDYGADWPEQIRIVGWVWIHQPKARKWKGK